MHVECSTCNARYTIADDKIPIQGARVRCRKCHAVFSIDRSMASAPPAPAELPLIPPTPQAPTEPPSPFSGPPTPMEPPSTFAPSSTPFGPPPEAPTDPPAVAPTEIERFANAFASSAPPSAPAPSPFGTSSASMATPFPGPAAAPAPPAAPPAAAFNTASGIPEGLPEPERLKHERARRLARVLASDIAIYNKEKRERGVKDGNLVAVLGYEIKKSWEVYKERVTPELANATPYFRDALNDMLAEGKKVF